MLSSISRREQFTKANSVDEIFFSNWIDKETIKILGATILLCSISGGVIDVMDKMKRTEPISASNMSDAALSIVQFATIKFSCLIFAAIGMKALKVTFKRRM